MQGTRDIALLDPALAGLLNLAKYEGPDIVDLTACYGYGIANNHPFNDGNKRTTFIVTELFLLMNGYELIANDAACVLKMLSVADGSITQKEFASWIREHIEKI